MTTNLDRALNALKAQQFTSIRAAARFYEVDHRTLTRRVHGSQSHSVAYQHLQKLTPAEEEALLQKVLERADRGFHLTMSQCNHMAAHLLNSRGLQVPPPISSRWYTKFVNRHQDELRGRFSRPYDYLRARAEDPDAIREWIRLVESTIMKHGITQGDIYNVDETGFTHGRISSQKVLDRRGRRTRPAQRIQPGCRDYTTVVECISGTGVVIPPLIILEGKSITESVLIRPIPHDWMFIESNKGWTSFEISWQWLQDVFEPNTRHTTGDWRLLILDGHDSHLTVEFDDFCTQHKIIVLCMPAHSSHLLQPLDLSIFSPLKVAYGAEIAKSAVLFDRVTKHDFLAAYAIARRTSITPRSITAGWEAAGLIPINSERVINKLVITKPAASQQRFTTPDNSSSTDNSSQLATPKNQRQFQKLARSTRRRTTENESVNRRLDKISKATELLHHRVSLIEMEKALVIAEVSQPRQYQKQYRVLSVNNIVSGAELQRRHNQLEDREQLEGVARAATAATAVLRRCGICRQTGHNRGSCEARFDPALLDQS